MKVAFSLAEYEEKVGGGYAFGDNVAFLVDLPNRHSFSPDAAWYTGPGSVNQLAFLEGAPAFAAEIRSQEDYGPRGERKIAAKIADYFAAGTSVVWDVDSLCDDVVKVYKAGIAGVAAIYRKGDFAEAEPAVPGWRVSVDRLLS